MNTKTMGVVVGALALGAQAPSIQAQVAPATTQTPAAPTPGITITPATTQAPGVLVRSTIFASGNVPLKVDFVDAELKTVLQYIAKKTGLTFVVDSKATYHPITLHMENWPVSEALFWVAEAAGADIWETSGTYYAGPKGSAPAAVRSGQQVRLQDLKRLESGLHRLVDIKIHDGTVQQAAEALAGASGVKIQVDKSVPPTIAGARTDFGSGAATDLRLTVEAQGVSLGTVLESIATRANLMIAPMPDGILLKSWPTININGEHTYYKGGRAPWSDEWQGRPTDSNYTSGLNGSQIGGFGGSFFASGQGVGDRVINSGGFGGQNFAGVSGGFGGGSGQALGAGGGFGVSGGGFSGGGQNFAGVSGGFGGGSTQALGAGQPVILQDGTVGQMENGRPTPYASTFLNGTINSGSAFGVPYGTPSSYQISGRYTMAVMGNLIVIAEPGSGPQGESGVTLTVYRWNDQRQALQKISSIFHRGQGVSRHAPAPGNRRTGSVLPPTPSQGLPAVGGGGFGGNDEAPEAVAPLPATTVTPPAPAPKPGALPTPAGKDSNPSPTPSPAQPELDTLPTPVPPTPDKPGTPVPEDPDDPL